MVPPLASGSDRRGAYAWYASYWEFRAAYLESRFADRWSLSPEQSLSIHAENWTLPKQLLVRTASGDNKPVTLPHNTSLFILRAKLPEPEEHASKKGLRLLSLPAALIAAGKERSSLYPEFLPRPTARAGRT